jgi:hypothetical protein
MFDDFYNDMKERGLIKVYNPYKDFSLEALGEWVTLNEGTIPDNSTEIKGTDFKEDIDFNKGELPKSINGDWTNKQN